MKKRLIIGLLSVSVIAVMVALLHKEVGASSCSAGYDHFTYRIPSPNGVEKHSCVQSRTGGSGIFDWSFWGISKKSLKGGLGLQVRYFGTEEPDTCVVPVLNPEGRDCICNPTTLDPTDPDCLIRGIVHCCNGGGQCGGVGQPFRSETLEARAVLEPGNCDSTGKCRDVLTLDVEEEQLECQNPNWGGTFTPEEMYVQSCTCDTGFDTNGQCSGTPSCNVQHCLVDLTDFQPGIHRIYDCSLSVP